MTAPRHVVKRRIHFGDCDPAQIVYYPRFFEMFDRATQEMFEEAGIDWKWMHANIEDFAGIPILEVKTNFRTPVAFGDDIEIHSWVGEVREKVFKVEHEITRDGQSTATGYELRALVLRDEASSKGVRAAPLPAYLLEKLPR
jgi:YbgC/YbaW family acyl-CoA thioester hydrolase